MEYGSTVCGKFLSRQNRFAAQVEVDGNPETVHVKNTGRCRELLLPGAQVILELSDNPGRKTKYDLITVYKEKLGWVNIDSQAPNKVMGEWLAKQDYTLVRPEYTYGNSRLDFYLERGEERFLMEVKGCTLEIDGVGYFPDAPTLRGIKHLHELSGAAAEGYRSILAFVIPMEGVLEVRPNWNTHPRFGQALEAAQAAGVEIWFLPCRVTENTLEIQGCRIRGKQI